MVVIVNKCTIQNIYSSTFLPTVYRWKGIFLFKRRVPLTSLQGVYNEFS